MKYETYETVPFFCLGNLQVNLITDAKVLEKLCLMELYIWDSTVFVMHFPDMIILDNSWEYAGHAQTNTGFQKRVRYI